MKEFDLAFHTPKYLPASKTKIAENAISNFSLKLDKFEITGTIFKFEKINMNKRKYFT